MRLFKNKAFSRFALKEGIGDDSLRTAVDEIERGLVDANLGGGVVKKRIARPGGGKSGGFRVITLYKARERAFFVYGFAKNERANIHRDELIAFKALASEILGYDDSKIQKAVRSGALIEVSIED